MQTINIEQICKKVTSGGTPLTTRSEFYTSGTIPWIKTKEVNYRRIYDAENKITELGLQNSSAKLIPENSIIVAMYGDGKTAGKVAINKVPVATNQACCNLIIDEEKADYRYVYYYLSKSYEALVNLKSGSGQQNLSATLIKNFPIILPPLKQQHRISDVLEALDDKIELNRKMNETLEQMARAIFKSWFIDFDPVHAKRQGKKPFAMDDNTAALFPDSFEQSELGDLPTEWQVANLSTGCDSIFSGGTPSTQNTAFWGGELPWLSSGETRESIIVSTEKYITQAGVDGSSTRMARAGSVVVAGAGQGHTRGQTSLLSFDSFINQSVLGLSANNNLISDFWLFTNLSRRYEQFRQLSDSHSSRGSLTTKLVAGIRMVFPPKPVIAAFDKIAEPTYQAIINNLKENQTLAETRDLLLPRLLSGELIVKELNS